MEDSTYLCFIFRQIDQDPMVGGGEAGLLGGMSVSCRWPSQFIPSLRNHYHSSLCSIYAIATRRSMPDIGSVEWATGDQGRERGSDGGWRNAHPSDGYCS